MKEKRLQDIIRYTNEAGMLSYADLGAMAHVSNITIRRDIAELESRGLLARIHGGVKAIPQNGPIDLPKSVRVSINIAEKQRIALHAAKMIDPEDAIILDSSSTVLELAKLLVNIAYPLTVFTNDLDIALLLTDNPHIELIMVGGKIRCGFHNAVGLFSASFWQQIKVNKLFLGVDAIDSKYGLFNHNQEEIEGKRLMLRCAQKTFVLADYSKFCTSSVVQICPFSSIDSIITNTEAPADLLAQFPHREKLLLV